MSYRPSEPAPAAPAPEDFAALSDAQNEAALRKLIAERTKRVTRAVTK